MKKALGCILALALLFGAGGRAFTFNAVRSTQNLVVNGAGVACEKYNIDHSNYFKLRDLAQLLNGTGSQFDVGWDAAAGVVSVTTGQPYTSPNGHELELGEDRSATAAVSAQTVMIDGAVRTDLTVYNIGGSNFFKLRELGDALGFDVDFDPAANTAFVASREAGAPAPDPAAEDGVYAFLKSQTVSRGEAADGTYAYPFCRQSAEGFDFTFSLAFVPADEEVRLCCSGVDAMGSYDVFIRMKEGLPVPYEFAAGVRIDDCPQLDWYATGTFRPSDFSADEGSFAYGSFVGPEDEKSDATELILVSIRETFAVLEYLVLLDSGYSLTDLGFPAPLH